MDFAQIWVILKLSLRPKGIKCRNISAVTVSAGRYNGRKSYGRTLANGKSRLVLLLVWSILVFLLVYFREIQNVLPSIECWEGSLILSLLMRNINSNTLTFGIFQ